MTKRNGQTLAAIICTAGMIAYVLLALVTQ